MKSSTYKLTAEKTSGLNTASETFKKNLDINAGFFYLKNSIAMKYFLKKILLPCTFILSGLSGFPQYSVNVQTNASFPPCPIIEQYVPSNRITSTITYTGKSSIDVILYGKIVCHSPSPFFIQLDPQYSSQIPITLDSMMRSKIVMGNALLEAFGFFNRKNLISDINLSLITTNGQIVLPDGNYSICFYAKQIVNGQTSIVSDTALGCGNFTIAPPQLNINTLVRPPANPIFSQTLSSGGVMPNIISNIPPGCSVQSQVRLFGKIQQVSPSQFTLTTNSNYQQQNSITIQSGLIKPLPGDLMDALGNLTANNLDATGINLSDIQDANGNIKLPDGNYRICFYARYLINGDLGGNATDPNLGCGTFTICNQAGGAPQFTQPINSLNINSEIPLVRPASPVIFTWLAPQSTCGLPLGGFRYDLELWELFDNQNVTDAINNPFVFRKMGLPSPTFLLDTNLNRNVLQEGKRYAIRVRAVSNNANSTIAIDNDGYSRIEAFQYGSNLTTTQNGIPIDPQDYYIPFRERKSNFWDDVYAGVKKHSRSDTLMPIKEYIAFALTQNETAYSLDAIDLFLSLNPELAEVKNVKISYDPQLPVFPEVSENDRMNFGKEHQANLAPYSIEKSRFLKYLDTLNNYKEKIPGDAAKLIDDLTAHLNNIKEEIDSADQVTVNYINLALAELVYEIRFYASGINKSQYNQLQGVVSTLMDLTSESLNSTSFIYPLLFQKTSSLNSYKQIIKKDLNKTAELNYLVSDSRKNLFAAIVKQLLPYDIIVWRKSKEPPYKPVLDAPDLAATYRIFYTLTKLYNHRNPEVNAKSSNRLASTIQVSLPSNTVFKFWTLNMSSHKMTNAEDVDLMDVLEHTKTVAPGAKKPSIVIKVD